MVVGTMFLAFAAAGRWKALAGVTPSKEAAEHQKHNAAALYEELYANRGYHSDLGLTHAKPIAGFIAANYIEQVRHGVLDVGCSHGRGVQLLWDHGIRASGTDISPTAINMARANRRNVTFCDSGSCFRTGNATAIPFADKAFDAIMSTDVIEHVHPSDVDAMVAEFRRVVRSLLFVMISNKRTHGGSDIPELHKKHMFSEFTTLHTTTMKKSSWIERFENGGFSLVEDLCKWQPVAKAGVAGCDAGSYLNFVFRLRAQ